MKKVTLFFATVLMILTSATATVNPTFDHNGNDLWETRRYRLTQPVIFTERGVEFLIFPNGEFDFNTEPFGNYFGNNVYRNKRTRRNILNTTYGAPGQVQNFAGPHGTLVLHDRLGRVRRVGNVFINYDSFGRVKRIGSVYMRYRHGLLKRIGGMTLRYNRWGQIVGSSGFINTWNQNTGVYTQNGYISEPFNSSWSFNWNQDDWGTYDDDYFYYRDNSGNVSKRKKQKDLVRELDD